jgi:hypothetical protein
MSYTRAEILEHAERIGKSRATLRRWVAQGCDLRNHASVQAWIEKNKLKETNVTKSRRRRGTAPKASPHSQRTFSGVFEPVGNGELPPAGKHGAQHALQRPEFEESQAYQRLRLALQNGTPLEVDSAQSFWLRCSESLRRLDLSVELARRDAEEQIPKRLASEIATAISDWLRISFMIFLSSQCQVLMGIRDTNQWKAHAITAFKSILHLVEKVHYTLVLNLHLQYKKFLIRTNIICAISTCPPATRCYWPREKIPKQVM